MKTSHVKSALDEMEYKTGQGSMGQDMDVAVPCQLAFVETPSQDTERFHSALEDRGYSKLDTHPDRRSTESDYPYYDGEICSQEHYNRMKVSVNNKGIRLYPHDNWEPTLTELASITKAIEIGFDARLEHNPID